MMRGIRIEGDGGIVFFLVFYLFILIVCGIVVIFVVFVYFVVDDFVVGEIMYVFFVESIDRFVCYFFKVDFFKNG